MVSVLILVLTGHMIKLFYSTAHLTLFYLKDISFVFFKDHFMLPDEYEDPAVLYAAITTHEKVKIAKLYAVV